MRLFEPGKILVTPGTASTLFDTLELLELLGRHTSGDWGELDNEDKGANDQAMVDGSRLLSAYTTRSGAKLWIITEAVAEDGSRSSTTILLPEEY